MNVINKPVKFQANQRNIKGEILDQKIKVKRDCIDIIDISNLIFVFVKTKNSGIFDGILVKD